MANYPSTTTTQFTGSLDLTDGGSVGIGTTSPAGLLHVQSPSGGHDLNVYFTPESNSYKTTLHLWHPNAGKGAIEYDSNNNKMQLYTCGNSQMTIDNSGLVGIGTPNPTNKLHVYVGASGYIKLGYDAGGSGASGIVFDEGGTQRAYLVWNDYANEYQFYAGGSSDANIKMVITEGGLVGIGTVSPSYPLDVNGNINSSGKLFLSGDPTNGGQRVLQLGSLSGWSEIGTRRSSGGPYMAYNATHAANSDSWSQNYSSSPSWLLINDGSNGFNIMYANSGASAAAFASFWTGRFKIDTSGNIGIGTTNPGAILDINVPNSGTQTMLALSNSAGGYADVAQLDYNATTSPYPLTLSLKHNRPFAISGGSVGIGTTSPDANLKVDAGTSTTDAGVLKTLCISQNSGGNNQNWMLPNQFNSQLNSTHNRYFMNLSSSINDFAPNQGDHIGIASFTYAQADRALLATGTGGDCWSFWGQTMNCNQTTPTTYTPHKSNGIGMELDIVNMDDNYFDDYPENCAQPRLMYALDLWNAAPVCTRHATRAITIDNGADSAGNIVGWSTGISCKGFIDTGIWLETPVPLLNRNLGGATLTPEAVGIRFGNHLTNLMRVVRNGVDMWGMSSDLNGNYLNITYNLTGPIASVIPDPNACGSGYTLNDILTIQGGGGSGGQVQATDVENGVISSVGINAGGSGYSVGDILKISGGSIPAGINVNSVNGSANGYLNIFAGGTGYSTATNVATTAQPGTGCYVDITVSGGAVISAQVHSGSGGSGYAVGDLLSINGGGGNASVVVATVNGSAITGFFIKTGGTGYSTATNVATTAQLGTGCYLDITVSGGVVITAQVHSGSGGNGYVAGDLLSINGGGGNAKVTVSSIDKTSMAVTSVSINGMCFQLNNGVGYSNGNGMATTAITGIGNMGTGCTVNITTVSGAVKKLKLYNAGSSYNATQQISGSGLATTGGSGNGCTLTIASIIRNGYGPSGYGSTPPGTSLLCMSNTGYIGIGTTNPGAKLEVNGNSSNVSSNLFSGNASDWAAFSVGRTGIDGTIAVAGAAGQWADSASAGDIVLRTTSTSQKVFINSGTGTGIAVNNASVGIGTTNPACRFQVNGGSTCFNGDRGTNNYFMVKGATDDNLLFVNQSGNDRVGIGATYPGSKLSVSGNVSIGSSYFGTAAPTDGMIVSGNLGVGTTSPNSKLQVSGGDIELGDTGKRLVFNVNNTGLGTQTDADGRKGLRVIRNPLGAPANSIRFGASNMYLVWEDA